VVGTNRQWAPFWHRERPTMADVILDQIDEDEIHILYGSQWRKSGLIDGAYEAEVYFPQVGQDGKWLWFTAAPIKSPDGTIVGAIETLWDKTEDKKSEEERERHTRELAALCSIYTALSAPWPIDYRIREALKEIQLFLKADDVSIYLKDNGGFFLQYHFGLIRNHKQSEVVHQQIIRAVALNGELELIDHLDPAAKPELAQLAKQGFLSMALVPISAKEKKSIGVLQVASRTPRQFTPGQRHVLDLIGNRIGVAIENAMLQEQYIKSEEKYRSLFNNDPNPIFIINQQTMKILDINERAQECYGYERQELNRKLFLELGDPDDHEMRSGLAALELGQSILFSKKRHYRKDGGTFFVNINVSRAQYGESDVLIATTTDITETIEKETQLIQASKMTTLGLMAAGMAHEINQPLNVIQICADFFLKNLRKGMPVQEKDLRSMAQDIVKNVERASGIIRHVRDFARQSEVIKSKININAPIQDVFKVLGHQIKAHQIELDLDLKPDIPCIMADHNRMEQVFINLVTNAIDAMDEKAEKPEYKGMTKCLRIQTSSQDDQVVITVTDNGLGMSTEVISKIFEPFFTTKKVGKGTGLGVSISYGIVKDYEGSIRIDSQEGKGATFILTFPAVRC
jgi:PAS domain S-box-containing protein